MRGRNYIKEIILKLFRKMFDEAYYDKLKGEVIAIKDYLLLGVEQGEVLKDSRTCIQFDFRECIKNFYAKDYLKEK